VNHEAADPPADPVAAAVEHLHSAASAADATVGGRIFSPWAALASQIRLVGGAIDPNVDLTPTITTGAGITTSPRTFSASITLGPSSAAVLNSLAQAAAALDRTAPDPDVLIWIWHVRELRRLAGGLATRP
jgi:hypothetical protein